MKLFACTFCQNVLYFENTRCEKCGHLQGYWAPENRMLALEAEGTSWRAMAADGRGTPPPALLRYCANEADGACNWLLSADDEGRFCLACRHNGQVPVLHDAAQATLWVRVERAKRRLFYALLRLGLPLEPGPDSQSGRLMFDVLPDPLEAGAPRIMTGHESGLITLALSEADDAERERRRTNMNEPYRTLLGHVRHETGHYYWDMLVRDGGRLDECRALFGDDSQDYGEALARYYRDGPEPDWQERAVSAYATAHPWEDFAESFAHYLHIMDTLEMASAFGVRLRPRAARANTEGLIAALDFDPFAESDFDEIVDAWLPLTNMANNLNRCMGTPDLYTFMLSPPACEKLAFIHNVVRGAGRGARDGGQQQAEAA